MWLQFGYSYQVTLDSAKTPCYNGGTVKERRAPAEKVGRLSEAGSPYLVNRIAVFGKRYRFGEMGEDGKSWSLSRIGNTRCRGGGTIPKNWKSYSLQ